MQGFVFYRGPSQFTGAPILGIATGLEDPSPNPKTGPMVQVYILPQDTNPVAAVQTGDDDAVCGACRLRGRVVTSPLTGKRMNVERSCYVTLIHGPRVIWEAYRRGLYPDVPLAIARKLLRRRMVRIGAYGDPAAIPFAVWEAILPHDVLGYTQTWREHPEFSAFCMASVYSEAERDEAKALGFRTYRVRMKDAAPLAGEGQCPASEEMGRAVRCIDCFLCGGRRTPARADITVIAHGNGAVHFRPPDKKEPP